MIESLLKNYQAQNIEFLNRRSKCAKPTVRFHYLHINKKLIFTKSWVWDNLYQIKTIKKISSIKLYYLGPPVPGLKLLGHKVEGMGRYCFGALLLSNTRSRRRKRRSATKSCCYRGCQCCRRRTLSCRSCSWCTRRWSTSCWLTSGRHSSPRHRFEPRNEQGTINHISNRICRLEFACGQ